MFSKKIVPLSVSVVIVTYNPDIVKLKKLVNSLLSQCGNIYIVDNNSLNKSSISELCLGIDEVQVIFNDFNSGIALAQNLGIKLSVASGSKFTLLFDQDSLPNSQFISNLIEGFDELPNPEQIAAVGPMLYDSRYKFNYAFIILDKFGRRKKHVPDENDLKSIPVSCLIASGMLINNDCISKIGLMDESLFIDYVDTEWCLRCIDLKYRLYMIPKARLEHEIGDSNIKLFRYRVPIHSPARRYYRVRNGFILLRMKHIPKLLAFREILFSFVHQSILLVNSKNIGYIRYYFKSIKDALKKT